MIKKLANIISERRWVLSIAISFIGGIAFGVMLGEVPGEIPNSKSKILTKSQIQNPKVAETNTAYDSPSSSSEDEPHFGITKPPSPPKTGKEWHKQYVKDAGANSKSFELTSMDVFGKQAPLCKKTAMLKTVYETGNPLALSYFELALTGGLNVPPADKEALAGFAQRYLSKKAAIDDGAKQLLNRNRVANGALADSNEGPEGHPEGLSEE